MHRCCQCDSFECGPLKVCVFGGTSTTGCALQPVTWFLKCQTTLDVSNKTKGNLAWFTQQFVPEKVYVNTTQKPLSVYKLMQLGSRPRSLSANFSPPCVSRGTVAVVWDTGWSLRMSPICGSCPLDANSLPQSLWQPKMPHKIPKCLPNRTTYLRIPAPESDDSKVATFHRAC